MKYTHKMLIVKPQGKRLLARTRRRWEDSIKKDLSEIECEDWDWLELADYRVCISHSSSNKGR
jgi:hypothetical protein